MSKFKWLTAIVVFLCFAACNGGTGRYSSFADLPAEGWAYVDSITVRPCGVTAQANTMTVAVRHNDGYPYRNIWIEVCYPDCKGTVCRDTLNIELADTYGRWLATGFGDTRQIGRQLPGAVNIADSSYVRIRHIMRLDTLHGIEQIGVTIEPLKDDQ